MVPIDVVSESNIVADIIQPKDITRQRQMRMDLSCMEPMRCSARYSKGG
jgi:hypothetical protein